MLPDGTPFADNNGNPAVASDFEMDLLMMEPNERVNAELRLLEFHTPKMKSVDVDMTLSSEDKTIEDHLRALCGGEIEADEGDDD